MIKDKKKINKVLVCAENFFKQHQLKKRNLHITFQVHLKD